MSKYSRQREMILEVLMENKIHPTADWVYNRLKPDNPALSMGTVYRNLHFLAEKGLARKISVPGEADRFDGQMNQHIHFRCFRCGHLYDVSGEAVEEIVELACRFRGITGHDIFTEGLLLEGECKDCHTCQ